MKDRREAGEERRKAPEGVHPDTGSDYYHHPEIWDEASEEAWLAEMKRLRQQRLKRLGQ